VSKFKILKINQKEIFHPLFLRKIIKIQQIIQLNSKLKSNFSILHLKKEEDLKLKLVLNIALIKLKLSNHRLANFNKIKI